MFQSIGWPEIATILVIGLIVVGPERLPGLVMDVRAAFYAAKKAINNAKAELSGDFEEFEELRKPLADVARISRMKPRSAITHMLFDDDGELTDAFDPEKIMDASETAGAAHRRNTHNTGATAKAGSNRAAAGPKPEAARSQRQRERARPTMDPSPVPPSTSEGFSWDDIM